MRDFTDAEFDLFLNLLKRLRPDLEIERVADQAGRTGKLSRMHVFGRVIDTAFAGLPPTQDDFKFIQQETNMILTPAERTLEYLEATVSPVSAPLPPPELSVGEERGLNEHHGAIPQLVIWETNLNPCCPQP
jgi:hypothetical protein